MALPRHIQQQLDQADAFLAQQSAAQEPSHEPQIEAEVPPVEPQATAAPAAPVVTETPPAAPAPAQDTQYAELLSRHRTLQGMHRGYQDEIARLKDQLKANQTEPPKPEAVTDPKDTEVFGADLVDMVKRVAETMFGSVAKQFDSRLAVIEQRLEGNTHAVAKTADELFIDRLGTLVPDYEQINTSEGFLTWLAEVDEVYGVPRQQALTAAGEARDVERVAKVFRAYKKTLAPEPLITPAAPKPSVSALERQVAPRASTSAPVAPNAKRVFTVDEVNAFYRDVQRGVYRGREAEAQQFEATLNEALAEGRIDERPARRTM